MAQKTIIAIAHSDSDLGKPAEYTRAQLSLVKHMVGQIADQTMGGMPSTVLGAAEGLGTNRMDEIELRGAPLDKVKRLFRRQSTILQGQYPNVNVVMGSTCEAGCKAIVRIQLDQLKADGTLNRLKRPIYVLTGLQYEQHIQPVDGDVIVVGDCAKPVLDRFPNAQYWGECAEYPNCTPIWANRPDVGIAHYVRNLTAVQQANMVKSE